MSSFAHRRLIWLCWIVSALAAGFAGEVSSIEAAQTASPLYVKRDSWTETMLATRAAFLDTGRNRRPSRAKPRPSRSSASRSPAKGRARQVSVNVAGCRWLRLVTVLEQGGGNCHIWGDARLIAKDGSVTWLGSLKPASSASAGASCWSTRTGRTSR